MGSKGTHLYTIRRIPIRLRLQRIPRLPQLRDRPFPTLDTSIGWLQVRMGSQITIPAKSNLEQHLSRGVAAIVNYTYSHGLGNSSNANLGSQNNDSFRDARLFERVWKPGLRCPASLLLQAIRGICRLGLATLSQVVPGRFR